MIYVRIAIVALGNHADRNGRAVSDWRQAAMVILVVISLFGLAGMIITALLRRMETAKRRIVELRRALRASRNENKAMKLIADNANDGLVVQNAQGIIEWSNPAYSRMTGYSAEELLGSCPLELVVPPEERGTPEEIASFAYDFESGVLEKFEIVRNMRKNGEYFWNQLGFAVVDYEDGGDKKVIFIARDVTEQIEREEALERARDDLQKRAETDVLTGLPNRMKLDTFLEEQLQKSVSGGYGVGILHVDLDQFKQVNDTLGHAAGDAVLIRTAEVLRRHVGETGLASRFGGDEFIVICAHAENVQQLETLARRILADLHKPLDWEGVRIASGASIGISMSGPHNCDAHTLMRHADMALYEVKNSGRNGVMVYSDWLGSMILRRTEITSTLSRGIANEEFKVLLQPQFDLIDHRVTGFEALMRWYHPERGVLTPADFLAIAERNGHMEDIDMIAIRGALDALVTLREAGHEGLRMSINVSGRMLNQDSYLDRLKWETESRDLRPEDVAIEVLETILIEGDDNPAVKAIEALSAAGFHVELDDFGTGYSGLANLTRLKVGGVKIDRALVRNIVTDRTTQTVMRTVFRLCNDLGLSVVSEGVEHPEQAARIKAYGGRFVQGYAIARPMPLEQVMTWLDSTDMRTMLEMPASHDDVRRLA